MTKIETREQLIETLNNVAEVEHKFMCIYLYAAFSLKKNPDESCDAAKLEAVRRWTSKIYMIARQEMEHLSLVNSLLAAIGAPPYFARTNIYIENLNDQIEYTLEEDQKVLADESLSTSKLQRQRRQAQSKQDSSITSTSDEIPTARYQSDPEEDNKPCEFPFIFEPFDLKSARRYVCMESPKLFHLLNLPKELQEDVENWCFQDQDGKCNFCWSGELPKGTKEEEAGIGTIETLYDELREGFKRVAENDNSLFVSSQNRHQVEILSEYNVYIFPVTDLTSALNAIDLITKQGEGLINASPDFNSHFQNFYNIAKEYEKLTGGDAQNKFAILPVPRNPNREDIQNELTKEIFNLFNYSYVTLLYVLTGLYWRYKPASEEKDYPHLSAALREIAFAPTMTMLVRSLGEVLVQLPLDQDLNHVAAPNFYISDEEKKQLEIYASEDKNQLEECYTNIEFYLKRFEEIENALKSNDQEKPGIIDNLNNESYVNETLQCFKNKQKLEAIKKQLEYIYQNVYRLTGNLRKIYQTGVYSKFKTFS